MKAINYFKDNWDMILACVLFGIALFLYYKAVYA